MASGTPEGAITQADPGFVEIDELDLGDPFLSSLVRTANAGGLTANVTLWVSGAVISGLLIGVEEYFDTLADVLEATSADTEFAEYYRERAADFRKMVGEDFDAALAADYTVTYIHLRDVQDWSALGFPARTVVWRGRITQVDAWSFRSLGD